MQAPTREVTDNQEQPPQPQASEKRRIKYWNKDAGMYATLGVPSEWGSNKIKNLGLEQREGEGKSAFSSRVKAQRDKIFSNEKFSRPQYEDEYLRHQKERSARPWEEKWREAWIAGEDALIDMFKTGWDGSTEFAKTLVMNKAKAATTFTEGVGRASTDIAMLAMDAVGQARDKWGRWVENESPEWERKREYDRYLRNYAWNQDRMTNYGKWVTRTLNDSYINDVAAEAVAVVADPTVFVAGPAGKVVGATARGVGKVGASVPFVLGRGAEFAGKYTGKGIDWTVGLGGTITKKALGDRTIGNIAMGALGAALPNITIPLAKTRGAAAIAEYGGRIAGDATREMLGRVGQKRFLERLSHNTNLFKKQKWVRNAAGLANELGGTVIGDKIFQVMSEGVGMGVVDATIAGVLGEDTEGMGAAFGSSAPLGVVSGTVANRPGMGKTTNVFKEGKDGSIDIERGLIPGVTKSRIEKQIAQTQSKWDTAQDMFRQEQMSSFKDLPPYAQAVASMMDTGGMHGIKLSFLDRNVHTKVFRELNKDAKTVPHAYYDHESRRIVINKDAAKGRDRETMGVIMHEYAHPIVEGMIESDPTMVYNILKPYMSKGGKSIQYPFAIGDKADGKSIMLNADAMKFADDYNKSARADIINGDATNLAKEIFAEQFAMMYTKNPEKLNKIDGKIASLYHNVSHKIIEGLGLVDEAGDVLPNAISPTLKQSPHIQNLIRNQMKVTRKANDYALSIAERPAKVKPRDGMDVVDTYIDTLSIPGQQLGRIKKKDTERLLRATKSKEFKAFSDYVSDDPRYMGRIQGQQKNEGAFLSDAQMRFLDGKLGEDNTAWNNWKKIMQTKKNQKEMVFLDGKDNIVRGHFLVSSLSGAGNPSVKFLDSAKRDANIAILMDEGLIKDKKSFMAMVDEYAERVASGEMTGTFMDRNKIGNDMLVAVFYPQTALRHGGTKGYGKAFEGKLRSVLENRIAPYGKRRAMVNKLTGREGGQDKKSMMGDTIRTVSLQNMRADIGQLESTGFNANPDNLKYNMNPAFIGSESIGVEQPKAQIEREPSTINWGSEWDTSQQKANIEQLAPKPNTYESVEGVLEFRETRRKEFKEAIKQELGLDDKTAEAYRNAIESDNDSAIGRIEKGFNKEQKDRADWFWNESRYNRIGSDFKTWEVDKRWRNLESVENYSAEQAARSLVANLDQGFKGIDNPLESDKYVHAAVAAKRLGDLNATEMDIAKAIDAYTTEHSGSMSDKEYYFKELTGKLRRFLNEQGVSIRKEDSSLPTQSLPQP